MVDAGNPIVFAAAATQIALMTFFYYLANHYTSHKSVERWIGSLTMPTAMVIWALRRKSLNSTGSAWAFPVGFCLAFGSVRFMATLLVFFILSSKLTKWKAKRKGTISDEFSDDALGRNHVQVICNGGFPAILSLLYIWLGGAGDQQLTSDSSSIAAIGILVSISCACGDTWASEIGSTIQWGQPRLITTWQKVPAGTNGGITVVGTLASAAGGLVTGLTFWLTSLILGVPASWGIISLGGFAGIFGSGVDSLLGATLQYSGFHTERKVVVRCPGPGVKHVSGWNILSNNDVNLISCVVTTLIILGCILFFSLI
eukprot:m.3889 g.3889  ORF g.3889 m.3889 type:complete len:314 (+) comp9935_c0_seq1:58-999(+)